MQGFAPAKVNLWLRVVGRRTDGYHLLDSLVAFAAVGDSVAATPAETLSLTVDGPFAAGVPTGEENLVLRAARALMAEGAGASLHLTKTLPPASGIGGGSSDAAAALRVLTALWRLDPAHARAVAPHLGADVPACLAARPCRMQGIGEILSPVALPACGLVLANPRLPLETRAVFAARAGSFSKPFPPRAWPDAAALAADIGAAGNDLQPAAIALCPAVAEVLAALRALPGTLCAAMSGSGATCFALFAEPAAAAAAAMALPPTLWRWGGGLQPAEGVPVQPG